ncbi:MAG TPA: autotransporter-associated beta strand repeat-containing protein, partial [Tepidisphaeraceae bacterium]|nr:autotransporter-associated beta strand repeat-containing protein [Tepidisphaeraceae bacterium]
MSRSFRNRWARRAAVLSSAVAMVIAQISPRAASAGQTLYWDADANSAGNSFTTGAGLGGNGAWDAASNVWWSGSGADTVYSGTSADSVFFQGMGGVVQLGAPQTIGTLTFSQSIGTFNITGDGTSGANILTLQGTASTAGQINVATGLTDTISAVVAGANGLSINNGSNAGTLILSGANTYSGGTTLNAGTLGIFADNNLGNNSGGITFAGNSTLNLLAPVTLGAARTITVNSGITGTIGSAANAQQVVLGQVAFGSNTSVLALNNAGTTYLLNSANSNTGVLWVQQGTLIDPSFADAVGGGNLKLGSVANAGAFQYGAGVSGPLTLTNRAIELAGTTGGGTIDSSALSAANSITINSNLVVSGAGAKALTLTGFNTGINTFAGSISNSSGATSITKSGMDLWVLSNAANTNTGTLTINQGVLRGTTSAAFGASGSIV